MNIIEDSSITDFPLYVYIYRPDGYYEGKVTVTDNDSLVQMMDTEVKAAFLAGLEIRITDVCDYICWHAKDKKVIFPAKP